MLSGKLQLTLTSELEVDLLKSENLQLRLYENLAALRPAVQGRGRHFEIKRVSSN